MLRKGMILFLYLFCNVSLLIGQITNEDICDIYSKIIYELKAQVKRDYKQKELFVANQILIIDDFARFLNIANPLFENELEKRNIAFEKFINRTENICMDCFHRDIKLISEGNYHLKHKKNVKKSRGICFFSNIGYYDNFAIVRVIVQLSYSRRYSNFYFFQKDTSWKLVYFREGCD